jgi:hypothetical protein
MIRRAPNVRFSQEIGDSCIYGNLRNGVYRRDMVLKRAAILVALALLALLTASVLASPAQAEPGYFCLTAKATRTGDTYALSNIGCTGSGIYDVPVLVFSGQAAGSYVCRQVTFYPLSSEFEARGCVRT